MINTNFRQGAFKTGDDLVIIDPYHPNNWRIVCIRENYGITKDINVLVFYDFGEECIIDIFFNIYKIVKEYWYGRFKSCT